MVKNLIEHSEGYTCGAKVCLMVREVLREVLISFSSDTRMYRRDCDISEVPGNVWTMVPPRTTSLAIALMLHSMTRPPLHIVGNLCACA